MIQHHEGRFWVLSASGSNDFIERALMDFYKTTAMTNTQLGTFLRQDADFQDPSSSSSPLPALYADLAAHRNSNRSSFEASIDWWARLLFKAALLGVQPGSGPKATTSGKGKQAESKSGDADRLVIHLNQQLVEECTIEEVGRPLGLGTVAVSTHASGALQRVDY
jgi:charged multivesicular body protein 7